MLKNIKLHFAGIAQLVEPHVANVIVAGSSPVSRSIKGGIAKRLRQRSAKPLFIGSNPIAASNNSKDLANAGKSFFIWGLLRHFSLGKTYVTQVAKLVKSH